MILLQGLVDNLRATLDKVVRNPGHLRIKADLLKFTLKHLVKFLVIHLWLLGLRFLLVDLHATIVIVELDKILDDLLKANYHRFYLLVQL